jgi:hypothetical protein
MSDDPFYAPTHRIAPAVARPAERIWTLAKGAEQIACELRPDPYGIDVQFLRNQDFSHSRRFATREAAVRWADQERAALEADGWR